MPPQKGHGRLSVRPCGLRHLKPPHPKPQTLQKLYQMRTERVCDDMGIPKFFMACILAEFITRCYFYLKSIIKNQKEIFLLYFISN